MALSGSLTTSKYNSIGLKLSWTATQNISTNKSTISWTLKSVGGSSGSWTKAAPITVKIAGTTVLNITTRFNMYGDGGFQRTGSITVTHKDDGSRDVAMSVRAAIYSASVNCTGSKTFTLNKIDRYALLTEVSDFTDEVNNDGYPTISYTNPLGEGTVTDLKVRISWNGGSDYTSWHSLADDGSDSPYTFDSSSLTSQNISDMLDACPNSNTLDIEFELQSTMNGTNYVSKKTAVMSVVNANPTAGTVSYSDINPTSSGITGGGTYIVQKQSTLHISTTAPTIQKGASLYQVTLYFNDRSYDITDDLYQDIVKPDYNGTFEAKVRYIDTRMNYTDATVNITIVPWTEPSANIILERQNGFETNTDLKVDGSISSVTGSSMSITEQHKEVGGSYSSPTSVPDNTQVTLSLNNQKEWTVVVSVWDSFTVSTPTEYTLTVSKGIPIAFIDIDMNSVGVNGFPDDNAQLYVDGHVKADGVKFPFVMETAEHKVGYWIDGTTPVYEKTVVLNSSVTAAANSWTILESGWNNAVMPLVFHAWQDSTNKNLWEHLSIQWSSGDSTLKVLNIRSQAVDIDAFTIRYIYL